MSSAAGDAAKAAQQMTEKHSHIRWITKSQKLCPYGTKFLISKKRANVEEEEQKAEKKDDQRQPGESGGGGGGWLFCGFINEISVLKMKTGKGRWKK